MHSEDSFTKPVRLGRGGLGLVAWRAVSCEQSGALRLLHWCCAAPVLQGPTLLQYLSASNHGQQAVSFHRLMTFAEPSNANVTEVPDKHTAAAGSINRADCCLVLALLNRANACSAPDKVYDCPICYNKTTRTRFWGFVSCIVKLQDLATGRDTRLLQMAEMVSACVWCFGCSDTARPLISMCQRGHEEGHVP